MARVALGERVVTGLAVAVVGVRAAVEGVVCRPGEYGVVSGMAGESVVAALTVTMRGR